MYLRCRRRSLALVGPGISDPRLSPRRFRVSGRFAPGEGIVGTVFTVLGSDGDGFRLARYPPGSASTSTSS